MRTITLVFFCVLLLTLSQNASAQNEFATFTALQTSTNLQTSTSAPTISEFGCSVSKDRVILKWNVSSNETADRLIIQRSKNGKKFTMVGLVFGTDKADMDSYQFFEKMKSKKGFYRIIIVRKDQSVEYSPVISL